MSLSRKTALGLSAAAVLGVALLAWAFAPRPVEVEVARATVGPFEATVDEDGRTRVHDRYVVSAPLAGRLSRIGLREGDAVAAGAVVAQLTPAMSPLQDERTVREQGARVQVAEASLQRARTRIGAAEVALQQSRNEQQRTEQLARQGFVAPTRLEAERLAVQAALRELDTARAGEHIAEHELAQARAALGALRSGAPGAAAAFAVRAPVAGRVLRVHQPSEAVVALGAPLVDIGDTSRLEIVAELLTTEALQATPGARVHIERWGGPGTLEGRVRRVEPAAFTKVSALGVEEQRVNVLIDLASPAAQWAALGDGYRVGVRIVVRQDAQALQVPVSAVFPRAGAAGSAAAAGSAVFVLDGHHARLRPVEVAARHGGSAWVREGLRPGETVIVYPPAAVADGVRVSVRGDGSTP